MKINVNANLYKLSNLELRELRIAYNRERESIQEDLYRLNDSIARIGVLLKDSQVTEAMQEELHSTLE